MATKLNMLSDSAVRKVEATDKVQKLSDGGGLYLHVFPTGRKTFYFRCKYQKRPQQHTIGTYPQMTLAEARRIRVEFEALHKRGVDLSKHIRSLKHKGDDVMFMELAQEWLKFRAQQVNPRTIKDIQVRLEAYAFPFIGKLPVQQITSGDLLKALEKIQHMGSETVAGKVLSDCNQVFSRAIVLGHIENNPANGLRRHLAVPKRGNLAALMDDKAIGNLMAKLKQAHRHDLHRVAALMLPYIFVRPSEIVSARWQDIDFDKRVWVFKTSKTKFDLNVPLSNQVVMILQGLYEVTGGKHYVFHSDQSKSGHINSGACVREIRSLGYAANEMTAHGFRSIARTKLAELLRFEPQAIEHQLSHKVPGSLGTAYNRTQYLDDRIRMMQDWANWLDEQAEKVKGK